MCRESNRLSFIHTKSPGWARLPSVRAAETPPVSFLSSPGECRLLLLQGGQGFLQQHKPSMRVRRHSVTDGLQGLSQSPFPHSGPCGTVVVTSSGVVVTPSTSPSPRQPHTSQHSSLAEFVVHCAARLEISSGKTRHQGVGHVGTILLICMPRALESARHRSHAVPSHRSDTAPSPHSARTNMLK